MSHHPRDDSKEETRRALLRAARQLFAEQGVEAPSLDAICATAGFTRGAFYVHFDGRQSLVVAVLDEILDEFTAGVLGTPEVPVRLAQTIDRFVGLARLSQQELESGTLPPIRRLQLLDAAARAGGGLENVVRDTLRSAHDRLESLVSQASVGATRQPEVTAEALASLHLLIALGSIAATELEVDLDFEAARVAWFALLGLEDDG